MIVTPNPVFGLQWDEKDSSFLYLESKKVIVRDTDRFNIVKTISSPGENFVSGEFTTSVATGKNRIVSRTEDGSMYFWEHPYDESNVVSGYNYAGKIMGSAFSKNGNYIAFGDVYGDIHFLRQHQILKNEFSEKVVKGVNSPIYTLSFSEDCRFLVTGTQSGMAYVWNANTYKMVTAFNFYSRKNQRIIFDGDKIVFPVDKNTIGIRDFINSTGGTVDAKNLTTIKVSADIVDFDLDKAGNYMVVVNANNGMDYIDVKNKTYMKVQWAVEYLHRLAVDGKIRIEVRDQLANMEQRIMQLQAEVKERQDLEQGYVDTINQQTRQIDEQQKTLRLYRAIARHIGLTVDKQQQTFKERYDDVWVRPASCNYII